MRDFFIQPKPDSSRFTLPECWVEFIFNTHKSEQGPFILFIKFLLVRFAITVFVEIKKWIKGTITNRI
jgi:hypothetical protein